MSPPRSTVGLAGEPQKHQCCNRSGSESLCAVIADDWKGSGMQKGDHGQWQGPNGHRKFWRPGWTVLGTKWCPNSNHQSSRFQGRRNQCFKPMWRSIMSICDHHSPFGCNTMRGKAGAIINDSDQGGWNGQIAHHSISNGILWETEHTSQVGKRSLYRNSSIFNQG